VIPRNKKKEIYSKFGAGWLPTLSGTCRQKRCAGGEGKQESAALKGAKKTTRGQNDARQKRSRVSLRDQTTKNGRVLRKTSSRYHDLSKLKTGIGISNNNRRGFERKGLANVQKVEIMAEGSRSKQCNCGGVERKTYTTRKPKRTGYGLF